MIEIDQEVEEMEMLPLFQKETKLEMNLLKKLRKLAMV
jgi:hypothetical protein